MAETRIPNTVTRDDVARLAEVSVATVSYVVNEGPRHVRPETRARVLEAIDRLGYQPSEVARGLKTNRTLTVGLIVTDILNAFHSGVAKSIEEAARAAGYMLVLCNSDENVGQELMHLRMLQSKRVDGIILVPAGGNVDYINAIIEKGWSLVQVDRRVAGINADSVLMDNEQGAFEAVTHLIQSGHRRIAYLGPGSLTPGLERRSGYERALFSAEIPIDPALVCVGDFKAAVSTDLGSHLFSLPSPPTAVFAGNNRLALHVLRLLRGRGLRMPQDIALCVFDDNEYYALWSPAITAVSYSIADLGRKAFECLMEQVTGTREAGQQRHERVPCTLVVRESTRPVGFIRQ